MPKCPYNERRGHGRRQKNLYQKGGRVERERERDKKKNRERERESERERVREGPSCDVMVTVHRIFLMGTWSLTLALSPNHNMSSRSVAWQARAT